MLLPIDLVLKHFMLVYSTILLHHFSRPYSQRFTLVSFSDYKSNQEKVVNILANYFSTMANEIGGAGVNCLTEDDLSSHPNLINICNANKSNLN